MRPHIYKKSAKLLSGIAAAVMFATLVAGCKPNVSNKTETQPKTFAVAFSVDGENGTLKATIDGKPIISPVAVEKGKIVVFTASPKTGYEVRNWTVNGIAVASTITYNHTVTANAEIKLSFKLKTPATGEYIKVAYGELNNHLNKTLPASDGIYYIEVTGLTKNDVKGDNEKESSPLGKILAKYSQKRVALKFGTEIPGCTDMSGCFFYCKNLVQAPEIPANVTNMSRCFSYCTGLTQTPKIPDGVTDISGCFSGWENLTQAPVIPANVINMSGCFSGCSGLTQGPDIPASVTHMNYCFENCTKLTSIVLFCNYKEDEYKEYYFQGVFTGCTGGLQTGSIKVPLDQLDIYKNNAEKMGAQKEWFRS